MARRDKVLQTCDSEPAVVRTNQEQTRRRLMRF